MSANHKTLSASLLTTLNEFQGHLDILVNNASAIGLLQCPSARLSVRRFPQRSEYQPDRNFAIKKALPAMIENGGSIINVTSDAGVTGYPGYGIPNLTRRTVADLGSRT